MANRTVSDAIAIHGTNPQYLIEKIIRSRIYDSLYWKESCFGLTAETLIDRAAALTSFGDIVVEFLRNEDHKYLRALGAFYLRLVGTSLEIYQYLEPLLNDYRKLRRRTLGGDFDIISMDEFIDELLREERVCDTIMPRITKRYVLEENEELPPRISALEEDLEDEEDEVDFLSKSEKSADRDNHREKDDYEFHQNSRPRSRSISLSSRGERPPRKYRDLSRDAYERGRTRQIHAGATLTVVQAEIGEKGITPEAEVEKHIIIEDLIQRVEVPAAADEQNIFYGGALSSGIKEIKGHLGVSGNEQADALARAAASFSWWLLYRIGEHFLRGSGSVVFGNSRHFVCNVFRSVNQLHWEISSGSQIVVGSLHVTWETCSGLSCSSFCVSQLLSTCTSDVVTDAALCKGFIFRDWYQKSVSTFKDPKMVAINVMNFVHDFCIAFQDDIWLVCAKYHAVMERNGLILHDGFIPVSVSDFSEQLLSGVVRLLSVAKAFGISFGFHKFCLFFSDTCNGVLVYIGV
ncbi:hypothetical protein G9A89_020584 [Geosiphon pyriformis]|nr:hypothetical protein G9A89_020584 [Geosiphon pyriformis]